MMGLRHVLLLLLALLPAGCGFHLRGSAPVQYGFKSLYLKASAETPLLDELRQTLSAAQIAVTNTPGEAELVLEILSEQPGKEILSLSASGRVQEYSLRYRVLLHAYDAQRRDWIPVSEILLTRILAYDDTQVLAKEQEEAMLYKDMRADAATRILHRLKRAKPRP